VLIQRVEDDVSKTVDWETAIPGDTLTYEIVVRPNVTTEDLEYTIVDTIPDGLTYVDGSATATDGVVGVVDNVLTWTGVMAVPEMKYQIATSDTDPACAAPLASYDGVPDAYVNLEAFGILANSGIAGDTVCYSVDFSGGEFDFFGAPQGEVINFTDDGFAFFNPSSPGAAPWTHRPIPTTDDPNNLMAIFWRDMVIVYDGPSNRGVTLANLTSGGVPVAGIIEFDDLEPWPAGNTADRFDFEMVAYYDADPGRYEYIFAYNNLTGPIGLGTIGLENVDGSFGVQHAFNDIEVADGMAVCFDLVGQAESVVITYQVTVDASAHGILTNNVVHNTDNPSSMDASTSADVDILNIPPVCSTASPSIDILWPPKHQFVPVEVLGVTDANGDAITITIDSIFQDELVDALGDEDGETSPDGQGVGTSTAEVRAERDGMGNGRYYHISFTADDGYGGTCSGEVLVGVPVSMGQGGAPVDDGALYDSTIPHS
jgi:uncharacterized repeat protein (TIGR01451 family)